MDSGILVSEFGGPRLDEFSKRSGREGAIRSVCTVSLRGYAFGLKRAYEKRKMHIASQRPENRALLFRPL